MRSWWRHQMEWFSGLLALCGENSPVTGEFSSQRPVTQSFDVFFDLCLNKRLSKQSWGCWFETPLWLLWCHCNVRCDVRTSADAIAGISDCGAPLILVLHLVSFWEYQERLCVVYLRFSYHEKVPRGWVHLQWVLGAAHSAQWVSLVSVLSCLTVWEGCPTSRYF